MTAEILDHRAEIRDTANRAGIVILTRSGNPLPARVLTASILSQSAIITSTHPDHPVQTRVPWSTLERDVNKVRDHILQTPVTLPQNSLLQYPAE